jgi:hypothetical protein
MSYTFVLQIALFLKNFRDQIISNYFLVQKRCGIDFKKSQNVCTEITGTDFEGIKIHHWP